MTWRALVALGLLGAGCQTDPPAVPRDAAPVVVGATADLVDAGSPVVVAVADAGAPLRCGAVEVPPVLAQLGCPNEDEELLRRSAGFSADGRYLGACMAPCDSCPSHCQFAATAGPALDFTEWDARNDARAQALLRSDRPEAEVDRKVAELEDAGTAAFTKKLGALGLGPGAVGHGFSGPFPYPDLVLAQKASYDDTKDQGTLLFGARVGSEEPVYPIRIDLGPHPTRSVEPTLDPKLTGAERTVARDAARAEMREQFRIEAPLLLYVDVTKSGDDLGVVAVSKGTGWHEEAHAARLGVKEFAGRVYNDTGMRVLARGDAAGAATLFEKAEAARPDAALFSYNLACAYARSGNASAEAALARAIKRGGAAIGKRAAADADFASVRDAAWFRAITKP